MDSARAHAVLGVHVTTPLTEVRKRFRARARMLHPDAVGDERLRIEAEVAFIELNTAWELIQELDSKGQRHPTQTANTAGRTGGATGVKDDRPPPVRPTQPVNQLLSRTGRAMFLVLAIYAMLGLLQFDFARATTWVK